MIPRHLTDSCTIYQSSVSRDTSGGPTRTGNSGETTSYSSVPCKAFPSVSRQTLAMLQLQMIGGWTVFTQQSGIVNGMRIVPASTSKSLRVIGVNPWPATGSIPAYYECICEEVSP